MKSSIWVLYNPTDVGYLFGAIHVLKPQKEERPERYWSHLTIVTGVLFFLSEFR